MRGGRLIAGRHHFSGCVRALRQTAVAVVAHDDSVAISGDHRAGPMDELDAALTRVAGWLRGIDGTALGEGLIQVRERIDRTEAMFVDGVGRFDRSGEYAADGALSVINWLRWKCRLSGGAAAERVTIARQLDQLPKSGEAFANGDVGYQHMGLIARTDAHVGAAAVRQAESTLLQAAQTHDPGRFAGVTKDFEHRV